MFEHIMDNYWNGYSALLLSNLAIASFVAMIFLASSMCARKGVMWKVLGFLVVIIYADSVVLIIGAISNYNAAH